MINAKMYDNAKMFDNSAMFDKTRICSNAQMHGNAKMYGHAEMFGNAQMFGDSKLYGILKGDAICNETPVQIMGLTEWNDIATFFPCADGKKRMTLGCRFFTYEEAIAHWFNKPNRVRTLALVELAKAKGWL